MTRTPIVLLTLLLSCTFVFAQTWTTYNKTNSGLVSNNVHSVCIDGSGVKWFGTDNGLCRFNDYDWITYTTDNNLASNNIYDIVFEQGLLGAELWVTTDNGISVLAVPEGSVYFSDPIRTNNSALVSNSVYAAGIDINHLKWFGTDKGAASFNGTSWEKYTAEDYFLYVNTVTAVSNGPDGINYLATEGGGVSRIVDATTMASIIKKTWSFLCSDSVYAVYIDANNIRWFGTNHCLARHEGDETREGWTIYTTEDGLVNNWVLSICEDNSGNIWAGTKGGVSVLRGASFESYTTAHGLSGNVVFDMDIDLNGDVWCATDGGISKFSNSTIVRNTKSPDAFKGCVIDNYPNPFNSGTNIEFTIFQNAVTTVVIYNMAGQKIRDLVAGFYQNGRHTALWDGSDDRGQGVPSGIYFAHIISGAAVSTAKMVVTR